MALQTDRTSYNFSTEKIFSGMKLGKFTSAGVVVGSIETILVSLTDLLCNNWKCYIQISFQSKTDINLLFFWFLLHTGKFYNSECHCCQRLTIDLKWRIQHINNDSAINHDNIKTETFRNFPARFHLFIRQPVLKRNFCTIFHY